jgi:MerR family transcriptional regulator, copper efflux regulator
MRIGELASRAGVNIQTLRFYEREGLLRPPLRTVSGYRSYGEKDLERVLFIRLCQGLGFTLREIHQLFHLHTRIAEYDDKKTLKASAVKEIVEMAHERLTAIDDRITALNSMRSELASLIETLTGESPAACPVSRQR